MLNNLAVVAGALCLLAQQPQTPVFRGSTEMVVVDVQITDRSGTPLEGLAAGDFSLKVDGKTRPVAGVQFQRLSGQPATVRAADAFSTIADPNPVQAESYVLFVVDPPSMRPEPSRILLDQAAAFMTTLSPAHAVGLLIAPATRPQYPFSVLRQPMAAAFRKQLGVLRGDATSSELMGSLASLHAGIDALGAVDGRRTLIYLCDFLPGGLNGDVTSDVAWHANALDVSIDVIASDGLVIPSVSDRKAAPPPPPGGEYGALSMITDKTGGRLYRRVVNGAIVLPDIERALSAQYVLTFNVESGDKDGKRHTIDVKVNRKNVDVRFRKEFAR